MFDVIVDFPKMKVGVKTRGERVVEALRIGKIELEAQAREVVLVGLDRSGIVVDGEDRMLNPSALRVG